MSPEYKIRKINPQSPEPELIDESANVIAKGGIVVFPTSSLYGLGADSFNPKAVAEIFRIKKRPPDKPLLVLINHQRDLGKIVTHCNPLARMLIKKFWPGKVTILFPARPGLPICLTGGKASIGVRLPKHPAARALTGRLDRPITGTSANLSGEPGCSDIRRLSSEILKRCDLILDAGPLEGGIGSTIVDPNGPTPIILREGKISETQIHEALQGA